MSADADPVFETREALEAHELRRAGFYAAAAAKEKREADIWLDLFTPVERIRRVTAAHQHLKETPRHDD